MTQYQDRIIKEWKMYQEEICMKENISSWTIIFLKQTDQQTYAINFSNQHKTERLHNKIKLLESESYRTWYCAYTELKIRYTILDTIIPRPIKGCFTIYTDESIIYKTNIHINLNLFNPLPPKFQTHSSCFSFITVSKFIRVCK